LVALAGAGKLVFWLLERERLRKAGFAEVDAMDVGTFEHFLASLFRRLGYRVERTGRRGDYGADLVVARNGRRLVVQAKRWTKNVGVGAVQEPVAAKGYYRCDAALVVTNRAFTNQAKTLAHANDVELWGRDELVAKLFAFGRARETVEEIPAERAAADLQGAQCASCGVTVSDKVRDYCLLRREHFNGFPYCYRHQRGFAATDVHG
jgi:restriction system protein